MVRGKHKKSDCHEGGHDCHDITSVMREVMTVTHYDCHERGNDCHDIMTVTRELMTVMKEFMIERYSIEKKIRVTSFSQSFDPGTERI
jgi:hypothetical protein